MWFLYIRVKLFKFQLSFYPRADRYKNINEICDLQNPEKLGNLITIFVMKSNQGSGTKYEPWNYPSS